MTAAPPPDRRLAAAEWLTAATTRRVLAALEREGHTARIVGGAVRNTLLGRAVTDIDVATDALPEQVMRLAASAGLGAVPTGLKHGTVTVIADHHPFEVTTLRRDVDTDGRHATVAFTDDWQADAARRDFTINALYCDARGVLLDPVGGLPDLERRRVRFIGDPHARIREDYLRILRFFRFSAEYGDGRLDAEGLTACVSEKAGLARLSAERVRSELLKLLVAPASHPGIEAMGRAGLITPLIGRAGNVVAFERITAIAQRGARTYPPAGPVQVGGALVRLAALADAEPVDTAELMQRLRLSRAEADHILALAKIAGFACPDPSMAGRPPSGRTLRAAAYRHGTAAACDGLLLAWARCSTATDDAHWLTALAEIAKWPPPVFAFSGADILAHGVAPGKRVGEILRRLEDWWIAADFPTDHARLAAELTRLVMVSKE
ncbi:MAG: CCA tRNA nucleotidyltransferase [Hyphomicrobiaceae bacterium]|nr:CCA tRNA nucleotidyltransferase [Hyphomicrobiaceae bacterium]